MSFGFAYLVFVLKAVYEMLGQWKSSSQMCNLNQKSQSITMKKVQTHYHIEYWENTYYTERSGQIIDNTESGIF